MSEEAKMEELVALKRRIGSARISTQSDLVVAGAKFLNSQTPYRLCKDFDALG